MGQCPPRPAVTSEPSLHASLSTALLAVLPIFGLILAGGVAGRARVLGPNAVEGLNGFVVWLALPALLFQTVAQARWAELWQPGFIAAFGLGGLITFAVAVPVLRRRGGRPLADAAIEGLNASYPNVGFMGVPMATTLLGAQALLPTMITVVVTMCVFFAAAVVLAEISVHAGSGLMRGLLKVGQSLLRNPLIVAPLLGLPFALLGIELPDPLARFLRMLGAAASPCALVAIGLFFARGRPTGAAGDAPPAIVAGPRAIGFLVICKLLLQPVLTWLLAGPILGLEPLLIAVAVLMSALPTGTGAFMLADYYQRDGRVSSRTILVSTLIAVFTIPLVVVVFT